MNAPRPPGYYPNNMGRILLQAMEEVMGQAGVNAVLNTVNLSEYIGKYPPSNSERNFPFDHISRLQSGMECAYGPRGGRGLAVRTGRVWFTYSLRTFGSDLGLTELSFRLLPLKSRLEATLRALTRWFNDYSDQRVHLQWGKKTASWEIECCPLCSGRSAAEPCCQLAVGLLQEALFWVSGGKYFLVEEKKCIARGDSACTIMIDQEPMG